MFIYCSGQCMEMMSVVVLNVRAHVEHARTHRSSRVFRASEKESTPVARQPQPPCSLAHFRLRDTNTHRNKLRQLTLPIVSYL